MKLIKRPTASHMRQLYDWLKEEEKESGEGFFCNWNVISKTKDEGSLFIAEVDGEAVALLAWYKFSACAGIDILTVKPSLRGNGIGRFLVKSFFNSLRCSSVNNIKIQCEPPSSENFWLSFGFREQEDRKCERINGIPMGHLYMYCELCSEKL